MNVLKINKCRFKPVGIDGIYICDCAVFQAEFDKAGCNDWKKSSGKKMLEEWFKENASAEIQEKFRIDIPTVEEICSQKMLNSYDVFSKLKSKQFPILKDLDECMKEFNGEPTWWWTRSTDDDYYVWCVYRHGGIDGTSVADDIRGFVPVLRRKSKKRQIKTEMSK